MPTDASNEVVVITQDETGKPIANVVEVANADSPESIVEEVLDAIFDSDSDSETLENTAAPADVIEPVAIIEPVVILEPAVIEDETDTGGLATGAATEPASEADTIPAAPAEEVASAEAQANSDAAAQFQQDADSAIAAGDYEAASHLRESAENEAWQAGDSSMLHGSDSLHLETAADKQQLAAEYERDESQHAAAGNYEAAREDASRAATATSWADFNAGGSDHTGQANAEYQQMDWAVSEQNVADQDAITAESFAEAGQLDSAAVYADSAVEHQENADYHGDLGEHGGDMSVHDSSSDVTAYDSSSTPATDTSVDVSPSSVDSTE